MTNERPLVSPESVHTGAGCKGVENRPTHRKKIHGKRSDEVQSAEVRRTRRYQRRADNRRMGTDVFITAKNIKS